MARKRTNNQACDYKNLENRCLLAADIGFAMCTDANLPDSMSATSEMVAVESIAVDAASDSVDPETPTGELENMLNLDDGADGMFGSLTEEQPFEAMNFVAPADGVATLIVSSSFGEASTNLQVMDQDGEMVAISSTEALDGFQQLSFQVDKGVSYEASVGATEGTTGQFQATIEFVADPPIDLHVNKIGETATAIEVVDGRGAIAGELETDGDVDVFQYQAGGDGEVSLFAGETTDGNDVQLVVSISDAKGNEIATGSTNEFVETKFNVQQGQTFFVAIQANEGQTGAYQLALQEDVVARPVDRHADVIGQEATLLESNGGTMVQQGALETAEDQDAFRFVASETGETFLSASVIDSAMNELPVSSEVATTATPEDARLQVTVFDAEGNLLADATANQFLGLSFDTTAGQEYQILVDSLNDVPTMYFFDAVEVPSATDVPLVEAAGSDVTQEIVSSETRRNIDRLHQAIHDFDGLDATFENFGVDLWSDLTI